MQEATNWRKSANCAGSDPEAFFTDYGGSSYHEAVRHVCANCTVSSECLSFALKHDVHGFWGGTTERDRRVLKARMKVA